MGNQLKSGSTYAWLIVVACVGFYAIPVGLIGNTSGIFLTPVQEEFGWSRTTASLYMTLQPLVAAVVTPFAGKLMAKYNPRWLLTGAVLAYGLGTIWTAFGTQPWIWHVYGVIYGVACAFFMFLAVPTLINAWFHKRAGLAIGIAGGILSLISAIASPVAQSMITSMGWQQTRLILGIIITVVPTLLTVTLVRKDPISMNMLPYGLDPQEVQSGAAVAEETTVEDVVEDGATVAQARRSVAFYLLILASGLFVLGSAFFQQIPTFAANGPLGAAAGATAVSIVMIGSMIGKFLLGWMSDQFGGRVTGVFAGACGVLGIGLAFFAGSNTVLFFVGMGIYGMAFAALTIVSPMVTREAFGTANYSQIYSWVSTGIFVCSGLAAFLYAQIYDLTGTLDAAFILVMVFYVLIAIMIPIILATARRSWKPAASVNA